MCGIAGVTGVTIGEQALQAMGNAMARRGPDDAGYHREAGVALAFRRLAIVDIDGGRQPMSNDDGRIWIVFNGEIYDHPQLRAQLQARGHRFRTDHSDTEIIVHGWEEWGYDLFPRMNGMFAVAIWDGVERRLILVRDRYGIKPLYHALLPSGACVFGSEIKAILASGLVPARPNPEGVMEYFSFQNLTREQTMFAGINQVEPGTILTWRDGRMQHRRYWDISFPRSRREPMEQLAEEHRDILRRSIKRQLAADVPVQTYLSGGIDSTAITVVAHEFAPTLTGYSCVFELDGVGEDRFVDEREFSRLVADSLGMRRVELELQSHSLQDCLEDYVTVMEDLRMGMGYVNYLIAQRVAEDSKVVLSGTGGDEFHAGYVGRYQALGLDNAPPGHAPESWMRRLARLFRRGPTSASAGGSNPGTIYRNMLNCYVKRSDWDQAFTPEFVQQARGFDVGGLMDDFIGRCPSRDWRDRVLYVDAKTYLQGLLSFEDKVSMAHSLETRVPLLDNELVDFLLDVPFDVLWQGPVGKVLFRESVRPLVPPEIYTKPKMGFAPPDASWYRGPLRPWIEDLLRPHVSGERGILRPEFVHCFLAEHFSGERNHYPLIWMLLNFETWCRVFGFYGAASKPIALSA